MATNFREKWKKEEGKVQLSILKVCRINGKREVKEVLLTEEGGKTRRWQQISKNKMEKEEGKCS